MNLSIITVNYNDKNGLIQTLKSVERLVASNKNAIELLVVDGGSTDGSKDVIIDYYQSGIINKYISEPDKGIYDAMNKGLNLAGGRYSLFLNSGDFLKDYQSGIRIFDITVSENKPVVIFWKVIVIKDNANYKFYPNINDSDFCTWSKYPLNLPNHQAMLFPKEFYKNNFYDESFRINGDADYKVRAIELYGSKFFNEKLTCFTLGGVSSRSLDYKHYKLRVYELLKLARKHPRHFNNVNFLLVEIAKLTVKFFLKV
ncbi:glycosyltransferase [Vibrio fluvialis]|nr:glycosyltransferase [Vibrio fluvialis]